MPPASRKTPLPIKSLLTASLLITATGLHATPTSNTAFERFFVGTTEGAGTAKVIASGSHTVRDTSHGRKDVGGALLLDQTVEQQGKPARRRAWRLVLASDNRITGTISDARGGVTGEIAGNTLHLVYRMSDGPSVQQWITLQPDGRTARNRMTYHRFGFKVATVETVIRKVD